MQYVYKIVESFDAAHWLPNYLGPCSRVHGHCWNVTACWKFDEPLPQNGMHIDLKILKNNLQQALFCFDHHTVNELVTIPTAENIALDIWVRLKTTIEAGTHLYSVEVEETRGCSVLVRA